MAAELVSWLFRPLVYMLFPIDWGLPESTDDDLLIYSRSTDYLLHTKHFSA